MDTRYVPRPEIIANYYRDANCIDMHNQLQQDGLALEKKWITQDGNFRIATGLVGMTVVDVFKLAQFHGLIPKGIYD